MTNSVDERGYYEGRSERHCGGEHRTVGPHRAWCYGCTEWCYPDPDGVDVLESSACNGCRIPELEAEIRRLRERN